METESLDRTGPLLYNQRGRANAYALCALRLFIAPHSITLVAGCQISGRAFQQIVCESATPSPFDGPGHRLILATYVRV